MLTAITQKKAAEAKGIKNFTVRNSDKAVRLGNITQEEVGKIIAKPCNYGKGVTKSQFDRIVKSGEYGELSEEVQA